MAQATLSRSPVADHLRPVENCADDAALQEAHAAWDRVVSPSRFRVPPQPTPLLDRVDERRFATGLLVDEGVRLLTLVGPGGVGKTHLALALAESIAPGLVRGVRFVDLSATRDLEAARSLIQDVATDGRLVEPERAMPWAADGWENRSVVVLDNCEHLLPALAHEIAERLVVDRQLVIVATSREPLHRAASIGCPSSRSGCPSEPTRRHPRPCSRPRPSPSSSPALVPYARTSS